MMDKMLEGKQGNNSPPLDEFVNTPSTAESIAEKVKQYEQHQKNIKFATQLSAATTAFLTGQNAQGINTATKVGQSGIENNRRLHPSEWAIVRELQKGKTPEEQRRIELAAKYMVAADRGVNMLDKEKPVLMSEVQEGANYLAEQEMLSEAAFLKEKDMKKDRDFALIRMGSRAYMKPVNLEQYVMPPKNRTS